MPDIVGAGLNRQRLCPYPCSHGRSTMRPTDDMQRRNKLLIYSGNSKNNDVQRKHHHHMVLQPALPRQWRWDMTKPEPRLWGSVDSDSNRDFRNRWCLTSNSIAYKKCTCYALCGLIIRDSRTGLFNCLWAVHWT